MPKRLEGHLNHREHVRLRRLPDSDATTNATWRLMIDRAIPALLDRISETLGQFDGHTAKAAIEHSRLCQVFRENLTQVHYYPRNERIDEVRGAEVVAISPRMRDEAELRQRS